MKTDPLAQVSPEAAAEVLARTMVSSECLAGKESTSNLTHVARLSSLRAAGPGASVTLWVLTRGCPKFLAMQASLTWPFASSKPARESLLAR